MSINIINRALVKIGEPLISSTSQEPNGKICGIVYEDILEVLLESKDWRFALKRAILAPDAEKPLFGYETAYTLPADFICLYKFGQYYKRQNRSDNIVNSDEEYSIENGKILCNSKDMVYLMYISLEKEERKFSPWFKQALIAKLAAELAMRIKQSAKLAELFNNEFAYCLAEADKRNEIMNDSETIPDSSWMSVRDEVSNVY